MTTEIAIMNRRAVVLAADSAGTVTSWVNGIQQVRYFKGENKVFQLSNHHPLGLMTFANAHIQHVPWDIIIKEFRTDLDDTNYETVTEFGTRLFEYMESNHRVFPLSDREAAFREKVREQAFRIVLEAGQNLDLDSLSSDVEKTDALRTRILGRQHRITAGEIHASFTQGDIDKALSDLDDETQTLSGWLTNTPLAPAIPLVPELLSTAINLIFRNPAEIGSHTGIVVAGYGGGDIFPSLVEFRVLGFVRERLVFEKKNDHSISARKTGHISSFATTAMVDTFMNGVGIDLFVKVREAFDRASADLLDAAEQSLGGKVADRDTLLGKQKDAFTSQWVEELVREHKLPLDSVVSMLAVDEMANLAETLVTLESLKEKVTRPTESIGGPVDVAAITKAEGLVWIKRKHYFDLSLNARYHARMHKAGGSA